MPVLAVRCVITDQEGPPRARRDRWIEAIDFPSLVRAATSQLQATPEQCQYKLFAPDVGKAFVGVLLEVVHQGRSVLVGPMGGPSVPASLDDDKTCGFDELIAQTGFGPDAEGRGIYAVTVRFAGVLEADLGSQGPHLPARGPKESIAEYRARCASNERVRLARARYEGFHAFAYEARPVAWQAEHLAELVARVFAFLPDGEPPWRESGIIVQERLDDGADEGGAQDGRVRFALEVQRGDFVASLRLPVFPVPALVEWLASRRCEINLCHPVSVLTGSGADR